MALSRSFVEGMLQRSNRGVLEMLASDRRPDGDLPDPSDAMTLAMVELAQSVSDPASGPIDGELAVVPAALVSLLLRLADLRYKEMLLASVHAIVTEQGGPDRKEWSWAGQGLERQIARLSKEVSTMLHGSYAPATGYVMERPQPPDAYLESHYFDPTDD